MPGPITRIWLKGWDLGNHGLMGWAVAMTAIVADTQAQVRQLAWAADVRAQMEDLYARPGR